MTPWQPQHVAWHLTERQAEEIALEGDRLFSLLTLAGLTLRGPETLTITAGHRSLAVLAQNILLLLMESGCTEWRNCLATINMAARLLPREQNINGVLTK